MGKRRDTPSLSTACAAMAISVALTLGTLAMPVRAHLPLAPAALDDITSAGQA